MRNAARAQLGASALSLSGRTILQIIPRIDAGGAERTTIDIAAALAAEGAVAKVATEGGRLLSELQARGGVWAPFPASSKNPFAMSLNAIKLARLIREEGVDIVHARSRAPAWVAWRAAAVTKTPFVTTYHGAYRQGSALKSLYNSVMARGDAVIANSHWTQGEIISTYPFSKERITVIPRGVDLSLFSPAAVEAARIRTLRESWECQAEQRIILLAARLTPWKGHAVLIAAMKRLIDGGAHDICAVFAGDAQGRTAYARELDAAARKAGLKDHIPRVGHCGDMPAAMAAASVVVIPSTKPEAFGRIAIEAQAMGVPVIASELGATTETILAPPDCGDNERTGWRTPANDPDALAATLAAALNLSASAKDALALRARARATQFFSLEAMCSQTLNVYRNLLDAREAAPLA